MTGCALCPRRCGANRAVSRGYCGSGEKLRIARAALHFWEEPPVSGTRGSGAIFFTGFSLRCVFCQNSTISAENAHGRDFDTAEFIALMQSLESEGAHNINLVTPTHFAGQIAAALRQYKPRAVFASEIPVISAVGHETDFTICDFVADLRAPTPSAAAELAVPDRAEIALQAQGLVRRMRSAVQSGLDDRRQLLDTACAAAVLRGPAALLGTRKMQLDGAVQALKTAQERLWLRERERLSSLSARLDGMSPLKVMARGYAALSDQAGRPVRSVRDVSPGDGVRARLSDGALELTVSGAAAKEE